MEKKELNMKQFTATKTVKATPMTRTKVMLSSQFTAMHTYYNALATRLDFYLKF